LKNQGHVREFYDALYETRLDTVADLGRIQQNLQKMVLEPGDRVLDVGCGIGTTCFYLKQKNTSPVGVDFSYRAVHSALRLAHCTQVSQADAEALPFADQVFDKATFMGTLEHFPDPVRALCEVKRVLKKKASICFVVPNSRFFLFRFMQGTGQPYEKPRTYEEWKELFENVGLEVNAVHPDTGPRIIKGGLIRSIARKAILMISTMLPIQHAYQFVFICHN
jgi:ubiquinone/menaquinone biosynthesis C-methylase UbiE